MDRDIEKALDKLQESIDRVQREAQEREARLIKCINDMLQTAKTSWEDEQDEYAWACDAARREIG